MIVWEIIEYMALPFTVMVGAGWMVDRFFRIHIPTYERLLTLVVIPSYIFYGFHTTPPPLSLFLWFPVMFALLLIGCLSGGKKEETLHRLSLFQKTIRPTVVLLLLLYTTPPYVPAGNSIYLPWARTIGLSLYVMSEVAVTCLLPWFIEGNKNPLRRSFESIVTVPSLYGAILAFVTYAFSFSLDDTFLWPVLSHFAGAFLILASVLFGAELRHLTKEEMVHPGLFRLLFFLLAIPAAVYSMAPILPNENTLTPGMLVIFLVTPWVLMEIACLRVRRKDSVSWLHLLPLCLWMALLVGIPFLFPWEV